MWTGLCWALGWLLCRRQTLSPLMSISVQQETKLNKTLTLNVTGKGKSQDCE